MSNILNYFKVQDQNKQVECPACGTSLFKSKLNQHLDFSCASSVAPTTSSNGTAKNARLKIVNDTAKKHSSAKWKNSVKSSSSNRLSLKQQRTTVKVAKNPFQMRKTVSAQDDDIIILNEIHNSPYKSNSYNTRTPETVTISEVCNGLDMPTASAVQCDLNTNLTVDSSVTSSTVANHVIAGASTEPDDLQKFCSSEIYMKPTLIEKEKCFSNNLTKNTISKIVSNFSNHSAAENIPAKNIVSEEIQDVIPDNAFMFSDVEFPLENDVFSELSDSKENTQDKKETYAPYYIANFKHILKLVLEEEDNKILFNDEDMGFVKIFESLPDSSQKLYVRLFQRKYKWLRPNKINYPDITKNPKETLNELVKSGLVDSGDEKIELETALQLLSLPEAKNLSKQFNFNSGKSKTEIMHMLLKHCKEHKSVFFMSGSNSIANMMLKKVRQVIGPCYRISLLPKRVFTRILMLFSLPTLSEDDEEAAGGQQQQLLTLLQVNKGELTFPECKRTRESVIFCDRDELIRYEEARQLENDILNAVEKKDFELAKELSISAKEEFEDQCTCSFAERASSLPPFLKRYTSLHVYIRCMTQGVEVLQRLREYNEAVLLLKRLLQQKVFCQDYRGRWWDRLALNLEQHLKKPQDALDAIEKALKDKNVRVGLRYSLLTRALRLVKSLDDNDKFKKKILKAVADVIEAPKVVIRGRLFPRSILGRRHVFISSSSTVTDEDDITVLGVEQLAIEHYKGEGYVEGIHGESSTFHTLYGLLFWDIIYDGSIPDVFISPYQSHPLDLNSESFFLSREKQILSHLEILRQKTVQDLNEIIKSTWEAHYGKSSLVIWDGFTDLEHVQGLVRCLGNKIICGICERLAKDYRFTRSGVPDLVVWNPETLCVKIVEVKGPGDKLSSKQILWLDYLIKLGADAEVCLVEAVGAKKLRKE